MKNVFLHALFVLTSFCLKAQVNKDYVTQKIYGRVIDRISDGSVNGARIIVKYGNEERFTFSNSDGEFYFDSIPVGLVDVKVDKDHYNTAYLPQQRLISGRQMYLEIRIKEIVTEVLEEIVITNNSANRKIKRNTSNVINIDPTFFNDFPGNRNDPINILTNLPSTSGTDDQRGLITIRGVSPFGLVYRVENMNVIPPLHFSNVGISGSQVTMLNTNYIKDMNFNIGAYDARYGNALGGIVDFILTNGGTQKLQGIVGTTWNGFEFGLDGPLIKKSGSSFFLNYRYSFLAALDNICIGAAGTRSVPYYQDLNFKINVPTKKSGVFSIWGIVGPSSLSMKSPLPKISKHIYSNTPFFKPNDTGVNKFDVSYLTAILGFNHTYQWNERKNGKLYFGNSIYHYDGNQSYIFLDPSINFEKLKFSYKITAFTTGYDFTNKISAKNNILIGANAEFYIYEVNGNLYPEDFNNKFIYNFVEGASKSLLIKTYTSFRHYFKENFKIETGLYGQLFFLNKKFSIEPRIFSEYIFENRSKLSVTAGIVSQTQPLNFYFSQNASAESKERIKNLGMNKSAQTSLTYNVSVLNNVVLTSSVYYHYHFNIATDDSLRTFSVLNTGSNYYVSTYKYLSNKGVGKTYGVEFMLEYLKYRGFYGQVSYTWFDSKYAGSDGIWRNTFFNLGNKVTGIFGKNFYLNKNYIFIDSKVSYAGGNFVTPTKQIIQNEIKKEVLDYDNAYTQKTPYYFRLDVRVGFQMSTKKLTHTFSVDYWNITNRNNVSGVEKAVSYDGYIDEQEYIDQAKYKIPIFFYKLNF